MSRRHDFYGPIHKGLRFGAAQLLARLGSVDWRDAPASRELLAALGAYLGIAREHLEHEEAEINVILRMRAPVLAARLDRDHAEHESSFAALQAAIDAVAAASDGARAGHGRDLYLRFTLYVADDLAHMAREEDEAMALFHAWLPDDELMAIEGRIVQMIPPQRMPDYFRLMIPAASHPERVELLRMVLDSAPPEARAAILEHGVRPALPAADWTALSAALGQAP